MTDPTADHRIIVVGPASTDGSGSHEPLDDAADGGPTTEIMVPVTELVEQPAKVMRIGSMIKQLLDEVRGAPLDEAGRARLRDIHARSITELEAGLAPELVAELDRITLPFSDSVVPSESELRIAQAQLVGWLEGLFHGIQTTLFAQQLSARAQFEEMRRRSLPPGVGDGPDVVSDDTPPHRPGSGPYL